jgi:site-specific DNA-cytosine methylase
MTNLTFYEFFCGGGGARAGLGDGWQCLLANDNDPVKMRSYVDNWGKRGAITRDVAALTPPISRAGLRSRGRASPARISARPARGWASTAIAQTPCGRAWG